MLLDERDYPITDLGHWMRVALDWELIFLDRTLARYRVHDGAYSAGAASVTRSRGSRRSPARSPGRATSCRSTS